MPGPDSAALTDAEIAAVSPPLASPTPPAGVPAAPVPAQTGDVPPVGGGSSMQNPDIRSQILRPTDRPNEPITTGLPFGPGANFVNQPGETDARFRERVASGIETGPVTTPAVKAFAERIRKGQ